MMKKTEKKHNALIPLLKIVFMSMIILFPFSNIQAQETVDWDSEFECGFAEYKHGNWREALSHLEKIANALPSLSSDENSIGMLYLICGSCKQELGDIKSSIDYYSKALIMKGIQIELRTQLLCSQLNNYSALSMRNECETIINDMMKIFNVRKDIVLVEQIMSFYLKEGMYLKIISFENDITNIIASSRNTETNKDLHTIQLNSIYMCLAHSFSELNEYNKALVYCEKSLATINEYNKKNKSIIYAYMSKIYYDIGDKASALK